MLRIVVPSLIPICLLQFMLHKRFSIWKENVKETYLSMERKRILLSNSIDGINSILSWSLKQLSYRKAPLQATECRQVILGFNHMTRQ